MRFTMHIDGSDHQVEVTADGTLVLDGESFRVNVAGTTGTRRSVQVGDRSFEVRVVAGETNAAAQATGKEGSASTAESYVLEVGGERVSVGLAGVQAGTESAPGDSSATEGPAPVAVQTGPAQTGPEVVRDGIYAPVPGKIVNILVKAGDVVEQSQTVLVLEAMKMENELHAAKRSRVVSVLVAKGDQVERGQLLVALE